jgi:hypothetical protein
MQADVGWRHRATLRPFPGSGPFPALHYGKALPVARPGDLRASIPPYFPEHPRAGQDKLFPGADVRPHGNRAALS